ncbi:N-acetylmuramoyl-L-alanine amidase family protein [Pedobacter sp.]|uniref:N-acetylmuramoyl-L-alanine amidase family protein n=1 Tax=Pedobacter sp. TaxID=1411316 RepID=UPI003D7FAA7C
MRWNRSCYLMVVLAMIGSQSLFAQSNYKVSTIVIDAGHGGRKPGAAGSFSLEKNVALAVALKLGKKFEEEMPGVKILYTRKTDVDVDFYKRAAIANDAKADIFISIHCNSMPAKNRITKGTETFVAGMHRIDEQNVAIRENADIKLEKNYKANYDGYDPSDPETFIILSLFKNKFRDKSMQLAGLIQNNYTQVDKRVNRGIKEQGILILQRCGMPAVLTEIGFISNPDEEHYMNSFEGQQEIVNSIFNAVKVYKKRNDTN